MSLSFSAGVSGTGIVSASVPAASASAAGIISASAVVTTGGISAVIAAGISTVIAARIQAGRRGFRFAAGTEAIGVGVCLGLDQFFLANAAYHFMRAVAIVHISPVFFTNVIDVFAN